MLIADCQYCCHYVGGSPKKAIKMNQAWHSLAMCGSVQDEVRRRSTRGRLCGICRPRFGRWETVKDPCLMVKKCKKHVKTLVSSIDFPGIHWLRQIQQEFEKDRFAATVWEFEKSSRYWSSMKQYHGIARCKHMRGSINGNTPIAGCFVLWKVPSTNGWKLGVPLFQETSKYWMISTARLSASCRSSQDGTWKPRAKLEAQKEEAKRTGRLQVNPLDRTQDLLNDPINMAFILHVLLYIALSCLHRYILGPVMVLTQTFLRAGGYMLDQARWMVLSSRPKTTPALVPPKNATLGAEHRLSPTLPNLETSWHVLYCIIHDYI